MYMLHKCSYSHTVYICITLKLHYILIVPYGNHACSCGDVYNSYLYVIDNDGVDTEYGYPYTANVREADTSYAFCVAFLLHSFSFVQLLVCNIYVCFCNES